MVSLLSSSPFIVRLLKAKIDYSLVHLGVSSLINCSACVFIALISFDVYQYAVMTNICFDPFC